MVITLIKQTGSMLAGATLGGTFGVNHNALTIGIVAGAVFGLGLGILRRGITGKARNIFHLGKQSANQ